jgi:hypothetical protein
MSADPRAALNHLIAAFERHLEACGARRGEDDPTVIAAYDDLADAFEAYDGALYDAFEEMTPLDIYGGPEDSEDSDDDDDDDDDDEDDEDDEDDHEVLEVDGLDDHDDEDGDTDHLYGGLDAEDVDFDDRARS